MIKVGITGQAGFVGTHLYNTLGLMPDQYKRIPFEDEIFLDEKRLLHFVQQCDVIVHLAAMNRHEDEEVIYNTNISLVNQLIAACEATHSTPHILFSSSIQEDRDNLYGKSKKEGRELFENWATRNNAQFSGLVIPNVFGPFGQPFFNSVIATFCYQLTHHKDPKINVDAELKLIYVDELVKIILEKIQLRRVDGESADFGQSDVFAISHTTKIKVSALLNKLSGYKENYFKNGIFPVLDDPFDRNLFNTFVSYIDHAEFFPVNLKLNMDNRGSFVEVVKLNSGGQVSFSTTAPGITRGNHFHTRKVERFAVIKGKATIELRKIDRDEILSFKLDGTQPAFVDMPVWFTHNITNTGEEELYTIFWINEHFNPEDQDTYYEEV